MSNICLVCVSLRAGGTERIVSRVANHLSERHTVTILLLSRAEPFYDLHPKVSVLRPQVSRREEIGWRWYPKMLRYLWRSLGKSRPSLVLCFGEPIAPVILPLARMRGQRIMVFNRASPLTSLRGRRGVLNPLTYPLANRVIVQTRRAVELMRRRFRLSRFNVLPNPIDLPTSPREMKHRQRRIVNVGTLGGRKNQQGLIRAFAKIERQTGWELVFVGSGPDQPGLERLRDQLALRHSVFFLGQRNDVNEVLQDSRIFAFSSLTEGFPNALAEAMSAGCACISYDCPTGPSELIDHGVNGFLVKLGDEAEYTRLLQRLIDEPELCAKFSLNARVSMKRFEAGVVMARLEEMIEEASNKKQAQGIRIKDQGKQ